MNACAPSDHAPTQSQYPLLQLPVTRHLCDFDPYRLQCLNQTLRRELLGKLVCVVLKQSTMCTWTVLSKAFCLLAAMRQQHVLYVAV